MIKTQGFMLSGNLQELMDGRHYTILIKLLLTHSSEGYIIRNEIASRSSIHTAMY